MSQTTFTTPRIVHNMRSTEVFAYPACGGHVRKTVSRVELDWIGLTVVSGDELSDESTPIAVNKDRAHRDHHAEDAFALRLMQIGGRWWPSQKFYRHHRTSDYPYGYHYPPDLDVGITSEGGILILRTRGEDYKFIHMPDDVPMKPDTWSRLRLCSSMRERCSVLRAFGAMAYTSMHNCPELPSILEEGIAESWRYEELMNRMDSTEYLDWWLSSS
ncbi:hypothetical protein CLAFUW4_14381 [Fulvia fulva]|uniref:Uncharacterized protein n=1 Tax=Passalora fulva TaxID=5499 RepID=A0A9Q8UWI0_PASFU|nr:uncharacterized protein CLAFUR5_14212 [Fulvia fulva]UJO25028.1 hypothetical protein CLAFUR5_14212 [Fulvia fulva]WPV22874.1 hypothetical protein CLAFUW4_14381 [Fulvia fulva]